MLAASRKRPRMTLRLLAWLAVDMAGVLLFAAGGMYLVNGQALFVRLPTTLIEAAMLLAIGAVLMLVGTANMFRESLPVPPAGGPDGNG